MTTNETPDTGTPTPDAEAHVTADGHALQRGDVVHWWCNRACQVLSKRVTALLSNRMVSLENGSAASSGELWISLERCLLERLAAAEDIAKSFGEGAAKATANDIENVRREVRTIIGANLLALAGILEDSECRQETHEFYMTASTPTILRHLATEVVEYNHAAAIEQARIDGRCEILSAIDGLKRDALKSASLPTRTDIEREVRAQIVAELESEAAKLRTDAEPLHFGSDDDQLKPEDMEDLSRSLDCAADYIEANGREEG